jgi:hypothetical protein
MRFNPKWRFQAREASMTQKSLWRGVLIAVLSVSLATQGLAGQSRLAVRPDLIGPSSGGSIAKAGEEVLIGVVVAAVAVVVVIVLLVTHRPQRITGCVNTGANGMSVTDEKDKRSYTLSGGTTGVKPGNRMTLEGKRKNAGQAFVFEPHRVTRDFGACQP